MNSDELLSNVKNVAESVEKVTGLDIQAITLEVKKDLVNSIKTSTDLNGDGVFNVKDLDLDKDGKFSIKESSKAFNRMFKKFRLSLNELSYKKIYLSIIFSILSLIVTTIIEEITVMLIEPGTMKFVSKLIVFAVSMIPLISLDDIKRSMNNTITSLQTDNSNLIKDMTLKNDQISDLTYSRNYWEKRYNDTLVKKE
jgi:hypothetical protein